MGQPFETIRGAIPQHKTNTIQNISNTKADDQRPTEEPQQIREEDNIIVFEENQVLTQQSATEGGDTTHKDKMGGELELQGKIAITGEMIQVQDEEMLANRETQQDEGDLTLTNDQPGKSDEMDEELLDYDEDYEPTEQEKAEMELYEKELEEQEAQQQRA